MSNERFSRKTVAGMIAAHMRGEERCEANAGRRAFDYSDGTSQLRRRGRDMAQGDLDHIDRCVAFGRIAALRDLAESLGLSDLMP